LGANADIYNQLPVNENRSYLYQIKSAADYILFKGASAR